MKLVLNNGTTKEVDTSTIFNNQYITTDGDRVHDVNVKYIIDDIRLGDFYCSSVKQGTYDEVLAAIQEERSKINQCSKCYWFNKHTLIRDASSRETVRQDNLVTVTDKTVYELSCSYLENHDKCIHDINETPVLFREKNFCFFCEYPQGVPNMMPLRRFMIENADKYGIVPYLSTRKLRIDHDFIHDKKFGSYLFEASHWNDWFELSNSRNRFKFYLDFDNRKFILRDSIGYDSASVLGTSEYDHRTHTSKYVPIKGYQKFADWIWQIVDDFMSQKEK